MLRGRTNDKHRTAAFDYFTVHTDFLDGSTEDKFTLITPDRRRINLRPAGELKNNLLSGAKVKVKGYLLDDDLLFDAANSDNLVALGSSVPTSQQVLAGIPDSQGAQNTVVLMVNFSTAASNLSKSTVDDVVFNQTNSYYLENSYNKTSVSGASFGWYTLPMAQTCDTNLVHSEAIKAADNDVLFTDYSRLIIIAPYGPSCGWSGVGTIGKSSIATADGNVNMSTAWVHSDTAGIYVVAHELGHNFGVHHASFLNCGNLSMASSGCTISEYGDLYNIMGGRVAHMNAPHKEYIGWFYSGNILSVNSNGSYVLEPMETTSSNLKAIKIQRSPSDYLFLEYRQPLGYDAGLQNLPNSDVFLGGLVHALQYANKSLLIDTSPPANNVTPSLLLSQTFIDPDTFTQITVDSRTSDALTVSIVLGMSDFSPPTVSITSPTDGSSVSGIVDIFADASDPSGIQKVEFYKSGEIIPFATDFDAPYTVSLDTTYMHNGTNWIYAKAYDRAGEPWGKAGNASQSAYIGISVENVDALLPQVNITSPLNGAVLVGPAITVSADAQDNVGIYKVEFWGDGQSVAGDGPNNGPYVLFYSDYNAPYTVNTQFFGNGTHQVFAMAYDFVGNVASSSLISFTVTSDIAPPTISITSPLNGSLVKKNTNVTIAASASDQNGVSKVEFFVNNVLWCTDITSPYNCVWRVPSKPRVTYTLQAKAYDTSNNTESNTISVTSK